MRAKQRKNSLQKTGKIYPNYSNCNFQSVQTDSYPKRIFAKEKIQRIISTIFNIDFFNIHCKNV